MTSKHDLIAAMVEPVVTGLGFEFWGLEFLAQGRHSLLRIYIDAEQGITVDDCAAVSRQVSAILDVEDPIPGEYTLEVSSPGMERPLFRIEQYEQFVGSTVSIRLRTPFEGRRNFTGVLKAVEEGDIVVQVDDHEYLLPLDSIDKANIVAQF